MVAITRTAASSVAEQVISAVRSKLLLVIPEADTTGTITLRNGQGGNIVHVAAIGVPQTGKVFGEALFDKGISIQFSAAADRAAVVWEAL